MFLKDIWSILPNTSRKLVLSCTHASSSGECMSPVPHIENPRYYCHPLNISFLNTIWHFFVKNIQTLYMYLFYKCIYFFDLSFWATCCKDCEFERKVFLFTSKLQICLHRGGKNLPLRMLAFSCDSLTKSQVSTRKSVY